MFDISIRAEIKGLTKSLDALAYKQLPFAQAQAVNALAKRVQKVETENLQQTFPTLTPFTRTAVGMKRATKGDPTATVFVKPVAAQYLQPFEKQQPHFLGSKKGLLVPIDAAMNQYGNLPRGALAALKGRPDVYIGPIKTKAGIVNGVWQRVTKPGAVAPIVRGKGGKLKRLRNLNRGEGLKLLIRFKDSPVVKQRLNWGSKARATVAAHWLSDFNGEMTKALQTAR